ncbi:hypothetical protein GH868_30535, partial [Bacillus thuringiensis]|nr:hypothetical protein [Bacillus thuringiensis]
DIIKMVVLSICVALLLNVVVGKKNMDVGGSPPSRDRGCTLPCQHGGKCVIQSSGNHKCLCVANFVGPYCREQIRHNIKKRNSN